MKKFLRATALVLAVSVTLTACTNGAENLTDTSDHSQAMSDRSKATSGSEQSTRSESTNTPLTEENISIDTEALSLYSNAPVTQVTDQLFTMDDREGLYTGDWKGNRPEGKGKLVIDEYNYYSGEWQNGMLFGQCDFKLADINEESACIMRYEGECINGIPSGEGRLLTVVDTDENEYFVDISGDFSDESTLLCCTLNEEKRLTDIGGIRDGKYVSYVANPDIEGIYYQEEKSQYINEDVITSKYVGQTDENNVPNGYGYYERYITVKSNTINYWLKLRISKLGTWKNGHIDGYYIETMEREEWSEGWGKDAKPFSQIECIAGCIRDGKEVEDYISYTSKTYSSGKSDLIIVNMNKDTVNSYALDSDGKYRTSYRTEMNFHDDGSYGYQKIRYRIDDTGRAYMSYLGKPCVREGEFCNYDKNGKVINYGEPDLDGYGEGWESHEPDKTTIEKLIDFGKKAAPVLAGVAVGLTIAKPMTVMIDNAFDAIGSPEEIVENNRKSIAHSQKIEGILEKAEEEERRGNKHEAEELRKEAERVRGEYFWRD